MLTRDLLPDSLPSQTHWFYAYARCEFYLAYARLKVYLERTCPRAEGSLLRFLLPRQSGRIEVLPSGHLSALSPYSGFLYVMGEEIRNRNLCQCYQSNQGGQ